VEHYLKAWPESFQPIRVGLKRFEIRLNDRDYKVGDTLVLAEYIPDSTVAEHPGGHYTGNSVRAAVNYVMSEFPCHAVRPGFVVMSITAMEEVILNSGERHAKEKPAQNSPK